MKTAIQEAIIVVKNRIETIDETLMGKHSIHHLQQVERELYELLEKEKEQIIDAYENGVGDENERNLSGQFTNAEEYYNQTYNQKSIDAAELLYNIVKKEVDELNKDRYDT
jgi:hypothetical protein